MSERLPSLGGLANAVAVVGVPHSQTNTAAIMLANTGIPVVNHVTFPMSPHWYEATFQLPWLVLILCEPLSVAIAYEERRGGMYGDPYARGQKGRDPFDVFCEAWLAFQIWFKDAGERGIYPDRMNIICMDRMHQPPREKHRWVFGQELDDLKALVDRRDYAEFMAAPRMAQYVEWMREHREIFEFVDGVGRYGSGWWLNV